MRAACLSCDELTTEVSNKGRDNMITKENIECYYYGLAFTCDDSLMCTSNVGCLLVLDNAQLARTLPREPVWPGGKALSW